MATNSFPPQTFVVQADGKKHKPKTLDPRVRLVNADGSPFTGAGQAAAVADATDETATAQLNALLAALRAAGIIADK